MMSDIEKKMEENGAQPEAEPVVPAAEPEEVETTVPPPHNRSADLDRRIRAAVERMLETTENPYETVIISSQEARRLNQTKLKARSILHQATEHLEELVPEVPFVPRPVEDDEPEVKSTLEALERSALGLVEYELDGEVQPTKNHFVGEVDFLEPVKMPEPPAEEETAEEA
jgi:hypothetical protein